MAEKGGRIPNSFIESLLARADVVQVINQRVPLKKAGANYKACCPFHDEKTPSFNVSQSKQFYHCFGCGANGNAIKFLMEYDGLSFVEAVESLASQYGMEVPREKISPEQQKAQQEKQKKQHDLYDVMHMVTKFYRHQLRDHPNSDKPKEYLRKRGLSPEIAKEFVIGYAPDGWDVLTKNLNADARLQSQLTEAGMLIQKEGGGNYDRFRDRIMFPIRDGRGRVIAFGGRILDDGQPKYLNSPETPIFHKSNTLYGLYEMRQSREKADHILVVEGYMDVVALAQYGFRNAVATLGTATTVEHLELLFRQVKEVVFCFDGDSAGVKAGWKALELALPMMENERSVKFLFLPEGEDPDSMVRQEGLNGFKARVSSALSMSEFIIQGLQGKLSYPLDSAEGKQQLVALAEPYVKLANGLYQYLIVEAISNVVDLPAWRLEKQMNVRSGYAQFKKEGHKQAPAKPAVIKKVMTVALRVLRVLMNRPQWAEIFDQQLIKDLLQGEDADLRILGAYIKRLQQSDYQVEPVLQMMSDAGYQDIVDLLNASEIPNDDTFLQNEFEAGMLSIAANIDESKLGKSGWSQEEMSKLQRLLNSK